MRENRIYEAPENRILVFHLWINYISMLIDGFRNFEGGK